MAACSEIHTKRINRLWGKNVELFSVKPGGTYSDHWGFEGLLYMQIQHVPRSKHT